jgi:hypothetical protein
MRKNAAESKAFVLGRDRNVEKREQLSGAARLEDAITKYAGIKPRTPDWLLKVRGCGCNII